MNDPGKQAARGAACGGPGRERTAAGAISGSLAPLALGPGSVDDGSVSAVLVWRFGREYRRSGYEPRAVHHVEHRATRAVGVAMLASAAYIVVQSGRSLLAPKHPGQRAVGPALLVLPSWSPTRS
ncbi:hypothetical protein AB0D11_27340 [Streptomyces monashensis]|uniref:hypothetical protein n=1 Tax=Streptomyces monashensis TaxID=1678012 RepID=UPI00340E08CA